MMRSIFSVDNPVFKFISRIGDMFILSLLWLVTSIPVFTLGASTTALYYNTIKIVRGRDSSLVKNYFRAFKSNFKDSTIIFFIMLFGGAVVLSYLYYWAQSKEQIAFVMNALGLGVALMYFATLLFVFPVLAVFENKINDTLRTSFLMAIRHWKVSFVLVVCSFGISYVCYRIPIVAYIMLMIGSAILALIFSVQFVTVFRQYNPELAPDPEIEKPKEEKKKETHHVRRVRAGKVIK